MATYYPPVAFHFAVTFMLPQADARDMRFQEVSGLGMDLGTEELAEGGENRFVHQLPTGAKHGNLVLKRGLLTASPLILWVRAALEAFEFLPVPVVVTLLNEQHLPLAAWTLSRCYPVKWTIGNFNATDNGVAVESLELAYALQVSTLI